jgi:hypothetical protein
MDRIDSLYNDAEEIGASVADHLTNKDVPLNERWDLYAQIANHPAAAVLLKSEPYIVHFEAEKLLSDKKIFWYDDFGRDRYSTIHMLTMVEQCEENAEYSDDDKLSDPAFIDALKEEILQKQLLQFTYDW